MSELNLKFFKLLFLSSAFVFFVSARADDGKNPSMKIETCALVENGNSRPLLTIVRFFSDVIPSSRMYYEFSFGIPKGPSCARGDDSCPLLWSDSQQKFVTDFSQGQTEVVGAYSAMAMKRMSSFAGPQILILGTEDTLLCTDRCAKTAGHLANFILPGYEKSPSGYIEWNSKFYRYVAIKYINPKLAEFLHLNLKDKKTFQLYKMACQNQFDYKQQITPDSNNRTPVQVPPTGR